MAEASELNIGMYFLYKNEPLRVIRKEIVAYGTHSHSKLKFYAQGLQTKGEKIITLAHTDKVEILDITRKLGTLIARVGEKLQIMDSHSFETLDAEADSVLLSELNEGDEVTFINLNNKAIVLEKRSSS